MYPVLEAQNQQGRGAAGVLDFVDRLHKADRVAEKFVEVPESILRKPARDTSGKVARGAGIMDRRSVIGLGALGAAGISLGATAETAALPPAATIPLWPSAPPGSEGIAPGSTTFDPGATANSRRELAEIAKPMLVVFRPREPDGSAMLIAPGGGYLFENYDDEGVEPALRLNDAGITAFVLVYRLPGEGWKKRADVPLQDAQRAMRVIRAQGVRDYGIDPARVGVLGFSAGGHLAASLATRFGAAVYPPFDTIDAYDARPSFAALLYPVITMLPPFAHEASCERLLGKDASRELRAAYSPERAVSPETPPCFLAVAADDPDVPVDNSLAMFAGLRDARVPAEMHIFERGGHGFALHAGLPASSWPDLLLRWGASRGYFRAAAAKP